MKGHFMKHFKFLLLGTVAVLGTYIGTAQAKPWSQMKYNGYRPDYTDLLTAEQRTDLRSYLKYEEREPCQNYREPPIGFYRVNCTLMYRYPEVVENIPARPPIQSSPVRTVLSSYQINFGFDSFVIESAANSVLDQIAREIREYNPGEVTVSGHTDSSGKRDYNVTLSQRRAEMISRELNNRGVANRTMAKEAYGENNQAVDTKDGVKLRENRRVVVEFLK